MLVEACHSPSERWDHHREYERIRILSVANNAHLSAISDGLIQSPQIMTLQRCAHQAVDHNKELLLKLPLSEVTQPASRLTLVGSHSKALKEISHDCHHQEASQNQTGLKEASLVYRTDRMPFLSQNLSEYQRRVTT